MRPAMTRARVIGNSERSLKNVCYEISPLSAVISVVQVFRCPIPSVLKLCLICEMTKFSKQGKGAAHPTVCLGAKRTY